MITQEHIDRFNSKYVKQSNDCHRWTGSLDKDGYGSFYLLGKNRRAHRVAYLFNVGPIPPGMVVNHTCGRPWCVNFQHLNLLTPRENSLIDSRGLGAVNAKKTQCPRGHAYDGVFTKRQGGTYRTCSVCEKAKHRRLKQKWRDHDVLQDVMGWTGRSSQESEVNEAPQEMLGLA
jgi:hypothetical protein